MHYSRYSFPAPFWHCLFSSCVPSDHLILACHWLSMYRMLVYELLNQPLAAVRFSRAPSKSTRFEPLNTHHLSYCLSPLALQTFKFPFPLPRVLSALPQTTIRFTLEGPAPIYTYSTF